MKKWVSQNHSKIFFLISKFLEFNSQESLSSKERQKFVDKYKRDYEKPDSQRKPKK